MASREARLDGFQEFGIFLAQDLVHHRRGHARPLQLREGLAGIALDADHAVSGGEDRLHRLALAGIEASPVQERNRYPAPHDEPRRPLAPLHQRNRLLLSGERPVGGERLARYRQVGSVERAIAFHLGHGVRSPRLRPHRAAGRLRPQAGRSSRTPPREPHPAVPARDRPSRCRTMGSFIWSDTRSISFVLVRDTASATSARASNPSSVACFSQTRHALRQFRPVDRADRLLLAVETVIDHRAPLRIGALYHVCDHAMSVEPGIEVPGSIVPESGDHRPLIASVDHCARVSLQPGEHRVLLDPAERRPHRPVVGGDDALVAADQRHQGYRLRRGHGDVPAGAVVDLAVPAALAQMRAVWNPVFEDRLEGIGVDWAGEPERLRAPARPLRRRGDHADRGHHRGRGLPMAGSIGLFGACIPQGYAHCGKRTRRERAGSYITPILDKRGEGVPKSGVA